MTTRNARMLQKLSHCFRPHFIKIKNQSQPYENDGLHNEIHEKAKGESHMMVTIVSDSFEGKRHIERHRMIHKALRDEFNDHGLHALVINAKTRQEHEEKLKRMKKVRGGHPPSESE